MKRVLSLMIAIVAVATLYGCQAFNENAGEPGGNVVADPNATDPTNPDDTADTTDYSKDATECVTPADVVVSVSKESSIIANSGWTVSDSAEADSVVVTKVGDFSNTVEISNAAGKLSYTVKRTGTKAFAVCNIAYQDAASGSYTLSRGSFVIDRFNEGSADSPDVVNAGFYTLAFADSAVADATPAQGDATSAGAVMKIVTNVKADEVSAEEAPLTSSFADLQGAYYVTTLTEAVAEEAAPAADATVPAKAMKALLTK